MRNSKKCMAACHSLTLIDDILIGDPQEIAIIDALGWSKKQLDNGKIQLTSEDEKHTVQSIFTFHFNPEIKRMGGLSKAMTRLCYI